MVLESYTFTQTQRIMDAPGWKGKTLAKGLVFILSDVLLSLLSQTDLWKPFHTVSNYSVLKTL